MNQLSIKDAIMWGWRSVIRNFFAFLPFVIVYLLVNVVLGSIFDEKGGSGVFGSIFTFLINAPFVFILTRNLLKAITADKLARQDFLPKDFGRFKSFLVGQILMTALAGIAVGLPTAVVFGVAFGAGALSHNPSLVFFALPIALALALLCAVIVNARISFMLYALLDKGLKPLESLKESWALTRGSFWKVFTIQLLMVAMNVIGIFLFGIGLLFTIPFALLIHVYAYKILAQKELPAVQPLVP